MIIEWNAYPDNGALGYSLNNVFDWTANSLGDKEKEVSDVGSSAEVIEVARKEQKEVSDSSTSEDSACIQSEITLTETGEGITNAVSTASNITEDSGQFVETLGVIGNFLVTDSGSYLEEVAATSIVQISDNVQSLDSLEISVTALLIDSGSFADLTSVGKEFSVPDSGNFTDVVELTSQITGIDSGNFTDIVGTESYTSLEDFGELSENVWSVGEIGIADSATGLTVIPYIELPVLDSASSDEFLVMEVSLTFTDQALSEDAIDMSATIQIIESGTLIDESVSILTTCTVTDSGQLIDTISISGEGQIEISDVGSFVEVTETESSILWEDSCNSDEITQLDAQCTISDTASFSGYVGMQTTLAVTDISTSVDFSEIQSSLLALDSVNSSDETLIEAQTTVSDTASSSDFGLVEVQLSATDQILSETSIVTSITCTVSDIGQSIDTVSMLGEGQKEVLDVGSFVEDICATSSLTAFDSCSSEELSLIVNELVVTDTCSFVSSSDVQGLFSVMDTISSSDNELLEVQLLSVDQGWASDTTELTVWIETTDSVQGLTTILDIRFSVLDSGSFVENLLTETSLTFTDQSLSEDVTSITVIVQVIDTETLFEESVSFSEAHLVTDNGQSIETFIIGVILIDTGEGVSAINILVDAAAEDLGQNVETFEIAGSLLVSDESTGYDTAFWIPAYYHEIDRSAVVKFKRRSVRKR